MTAGDAGWATSLTRRSVLKQAKIRELTRALGTVTGKICLDLGGDNGAVSAALRVHGGQWSSADLDQRGIDSLREVLGGDVRAIEGTRIPFDTAVFDVVVIIDLLEHLDDDRAMVLECARVLRPGGVLIVNVPHVKPRSLINAVRNAVGLTDAWHGHVRPGYSLEGLRALLAPTFTLEDARTYSRACSEVIDVLMHVAFNVVGGKARDHTHTSKGTVVTRADVDRHKQAFGLLTLAFPFLRAFSWMDTLLPWQPGYKLIVRARLA
jgi:SAM-dependent methyltransferase